MPVYKINSTKDGRTWVYRCYKNGVQHYSKQYKTKQEAQEAERLFMMDSHNSSSHSFYLVALKYFEEMKTYNRESTYQSYYYNYTKCIEPFFKNYKINKITTNEIHEWHKFMDSKNYSVAYKNKTNTLLSSIFKYAIKYYDLKYNPVVEFGRFKSVDKVKEEPIKYITYEQFQQFISVIDDERYYALFNTLYYTGCRKSEIFALQWSSVDFSTNILDIHQTIARSLENDVTINPTKNNQNRKVKMNKTLIEILKKHKEEQMKYNEFSESWFVFGNELPIARTSVDRYKDKYIKESGCPYFTCHMLRHSAVTLLVNKMLEQDSNVDVNKALISLSKRFGHTPEVMMKIYAHLWEDKLQEPIVDILDNL